MPLMTNAEAFEYDFGIYATELWSMPEDKFLDWLNSESDRERPRDMIVRCGECKYFEESKHGWGRCTRAMDILISQADYCSMGERKDDGES